MQITRGKVESAQKVLIYGPEGIGKSTFAAAFPGAVFIDTEGSTKHMDVARLDTPVSWTMLLEEVRFIILNHSTCQTLVIDTIDWAEQLCVSHVCAKAQVGGIEDFGYGKGYTYLAEEFGNLLNLLSELIDRGVNVVLTGHAQIRKFEQPDEASAYDRWELKLQKKTAPLVKEWVDAQLFANYKTFVVKSESKTAKASGGKRVAHTVHAAAWDAKNRHDLPEEMSFARADYPTIVEGLVGTQQPAVAPAPVAPAPEPTPEPAAPAPVEDTPFGPVPVDSPEPAAPVLPDAEVPAHLKSLYQLMAKDGVTDPDIRQAVGSRTPAVYPVDTPIENYDPKYVEGVLIAAWPQVLEIIRTAKSGK